MTQFSGKTTLARQLGGTDWIPLCTSRTLLRAPTAESLRLAFTAMKSIIGLKTVLSRLDLRHPVRHLVLRPLATGCAPRGDRRARPPTAAHLRQAPAAQPSAARGTEGGAPSPARATFAMCAFSASETTRPGRARTAGEGLLRRLRGHRLSRPRLFIDNV